MIAGLADTHTALWYLIKNPRLLSRARESIDEAARAGHGIVLSPVSPAEIVYLGEKNPLEGPRLRMNSKRGVADPEYVMEEAPFTTEVRLQGR